MLLKKERKARRGTGEKILGKGKKQNFCLFSFLSVSDSFFLFFLSWVSKTRPGVLTVFGGVALFY